MAKATTAASKALLGGTWKRKKWYEILAPKEFSEQPIGETIAAEPDTLIGRTMSINLMILTKDIRKQNINVTFRIVSVSGLKAYTEFIDYSMIPSSIKRLVRKGKEKIDFSFPATTKDGRIVRIKPIIICRSMTSRSITTDIKEAATKMSEDILKQIDYGQFVKDIITQKFQRALKIQVSKIYPVKTADIRVSRLIK
ncbi:MAG: hypothetical protein WC755_04790 [Candidatus Woesearchaeota archaeon]|jgi:small subunit ribosomal protein S3Ae